MATMTMTGGGLALSFIAAQSDDNTFLFKVPVVVEEVLDTEGVNGRRWRTKYEQMTPAMVETISACSTWVTALAEAQYHRNMVGTLVGITWTAGGSPYVYKDVHVVSVISRPIAGAVVGGGAATNSAAFVRSTWILEPTDFKVFAT
jgi:hypothetical protein